MPNQPDRMLPAILAKPITEIAIAPKAEAEVAFVLARDLCGPGVTAADVLRATDFVMPCFEIVDSRIRDWKIKIQDTVADNATCGVFTLGGTRPGTIQGEAFRAFGQFKSFGVAVALLHGGRMVRVEQPDDSAFVHGVVAHDKSRAIFALATLRSTPSITPNAMRFEGLDAAATYRVRMVEPAGPGITIGRQNPTWMTGVELTGAALAKVGVRPPVLAPENAILVELERI